MANFTEPKYYREFRIVRIINIEIRYNLLLIHITCLILHIIFFSLQHNRHFYQYKNETGNVAFTNLFCKSPTLVPNNKSLNQLFFFFKHEKKVLESTIPVPTVCMYLLEQVEVHTYIDIRVYTCIPRITKTVSK